MVDDQLLHISTTEEVRQAALSNLRHMGFDGDQVEVMHANVAALRNNGMLLDLDITGLTMFDAKTNWTLDMGVDAKDARRSTKRLRIGRKNLLPDTKLQSIAQRIRAHLLDYSQAMTVFPGYRYVPYTAFMKWWDRHQELMAEWEDHVAWILDNYEGLKADCRADYAKHARDTWTKSVAIQRQYELGAFVDLVVADAISKFPTRERIMADLKVALKPPATFLLESEYKAELLRAQRVAQVAEEERIQHRLQTDAWYRADKARADELEAEAEIRKQQAWAATEERRATEAEAAQRIRVAEFQAQEEMAAIRAAQIEIARDVVANTVNPLVEIVAQNRDRIYATLSRLRTNIQKRGWVHGKEADAIRSLREWFQLMNITDDNEMESKLMALANSLDAVPASTTTTYDADRVLSSLNDAMTTALQDATEMAAAMELDAMSMMDI